MLPLLFPLKAPPASLFLRAASLPASEGPGRMSSSPLIIAVEAFVRGLPSHPAMLSPASATDGDNAGVVKLLCRESDASSAVLVGFRRTILWGL